MNLLLITEKGGYCIATLFLYIVWLAPESMINSIRKITSITAYILLTGAASYAQTAQDLLDSANRYKGSNFSKAASFAEKAYHLAISGSDTVTAAKASFTAGYGNYLDGNHDAALEWFLRAENLYTALDDDVQLAATYNEMIVFYSKHKKFEAGDSVSVKAIRIATRIEDTPLLANAHNNRGLLMYRRGMYDSALVNLKKAYHLHQHLNDRVGMSYGLDYMASVYAETGEYDKALDYLKQSRELKKEANDKMGEAIITNNIGEALLQQGDHATALSYFRNARKMAGDLSFSDLEAHTWQMEASALERKKDFPGAYTAIKKYQEIHSQILNEKRIKAIEDLQTKYETDKKAQENILLQQKNQVQALKLAQRKTAIITLALISMLIAGISYLLYNRYRLKQQSRMKTALMEQQELRARAVMDAEEHERQRLARELHDGVGQMLAATRRSIQISGSDPDGHITGRTTETLSLMDESIREVRQLSHSMMPPSLRNKELAEALAELTERTRHATDLEIRTDWVDMSHLVLDTTQTLMLYRAIQEIFSNIIRHAAATMVQFEMVNHHSELNIIIYDNGKGFDTASAAEGLGLKNIRSRIAYLGGTLELDSYPGKGTTYIIDLPLQVNA